MEKQDIREAMIQMELARKRLLMPVFQELGLTVGQPRILNKLYEQDHISQRELADNCFVDVATISRNLDRLEKAGYLTREKRPDSRRSFLVVLTKEGRECASKVHESFRCADEQMWRGLDDKEAEAFLACARKLIRNLQSGSHSAS